MEPSRNRMATVLSGMVRKPVPTATLKLWETNGHLEPTPATKDRDKRALYMAKALIRIVAQRVGCEEGAILAAAATIAEHAEAASNQFYVQMLREMAEGTYHQKQAERDRVFAAREAWHRDMDARQTDFMERLVKAKTPAERARLTAEGEALLAESKAQRAEDKK